MFSSVRRHPLIATLLALSLLTAGGFFLFLASFNLNDYRSELEQSLGAALDRPVRLGELHFTLGRGIKLDIHKAAIGDEQDDLSLKVDRLSLHLRLFPLLHRQLDIARLSIEGPAVTLRLGDTPVAESGTAMPQRMRQAVDLLRRTRIDSLTVRKATCSVFDRRSGEEKQWGVEEVTLQIGDLALAGPVSLAASGTIRSDGAATAWQVAGVVEFPSEDKGWEWTQVELDLTAQGISAATLQTLVPAANRPGLGLHGAANLTLRIQGRPAQGVAFTVQLRGESVTLDLPELYTKGVLLREIDLFGIWHSTAEGQRFGQLQLRIDELRAAGEIVFPHRSDRFLQAALNLAETPLPLVERYVPDRLYPAIVALLQRRETAGSVALEQVRIDWPAEGTPLLTGGVRLQQGRLSVPQVGTVSEIDLSLDWQGESLEVRHARARLLGGKVTVQGAVSVPPQGEAKVNLRLVGDLGGEAISQSLAADVRRRFGLSGPLAFVATLGGSPSRLTGDIGVDLAKAAVVFDGTPVKTADQAAHLQLLTTLTEAMLTIDQAKLTLPFAVLRLNGEVARTAEHPYRLGGEIARLSLEGMPVFSETQRSLTPRGEVDLRFELAGDRTGITKVGGAGEVSKLGLHLSGAVADLRGGSARLALSRDGMVFSNISALVGFSPVHAEGRLTWSPDFLLDLELDIPKIRAADLIFRSTRISLQRVHGGLSIGEDGMVFRQVSARIGDGTAVTVNGRLENYDAPKVALQIDAPRADIEQIIDLWSGEETNAADDEEVEPEVEIVTRIDEGDLYGLRFHHAEGTIVYRNGALTIQPLQLGIGSGKGRVTVSTGDLAADFPLLVVEGSLEGVNADAVYRQMLKQKGVVTGSLTGDFKLRGEIGRYLPTCSGEIRFQLKQGTLRGFTSLGRVFSLLNLSNLLTLRLPDLSSDGFPFDVVSGTLTMQKGVVRTENLLIDSNALDMALVGSHDYVNDRLDLILAAKPLRVVDKILSSIPLAGWVLTGEKKTLVTAQFRISGRPQDPKVEAIPVSSLSEMVVGIFKRTLGLPAKIVQDIGKAVEGGEK